MRQTSRILQLLESRPSLSLLSWAPFLEKWPPKITEGGPGGIHWPISRINPGDCIRWLHKVIYYSTAASFYHIRSRERTKYATVLHSKIICPGFKSFLAEGLEKTNFDVILSSGIINLLFDGLTYNTHGYFAHCLYFILAPSGLGKIQCNSQNVCAYYMLNHRIRCI